MSYNVKATFLSEGFFRRPGHLPNIPEGWNKMMKKAAKGRGIPALRTGREGLPSSGSLQGNLHSLLPLISSLYHIMGVYRRSQRLARKGCYTIPFDLTLL
nr:hypothetical protein MA16_Dca028252 [Ipomoea batatas]